MKKKRVFKLGSAFILFLLLSSACGRVAVATPSVPGQLETVVASTISALTMLAPVSTPVATQPAPIPSASSQYFVYTAVDNVNLRVGPGTLFKVSRVLAVNTKLQLLGRAPGEQWLKVMNDESIIGWVLVDWVKGGFDGPPPPIVQPEGVLLVTGTVRDASASPVTGIGFAVIQGSRRADAVTDQSGQFYAYLPNNMSGNWSVEYISISCTSNEMDSNCNCLNGNCGAPEPLAVSVTLPQNGILNFAWK